MYYIADFFLFSVCLSFCEFFFISDCHSFLSFCSLLICQLFCSYGRIIYSWFYKKEYEFEYAGTSPSKSRPGPGGHHLQHPGTILKFLFHIYLQKKKMNRISRNYVSTSTFELKGYFSQFCLSESFEEFASNCWNKVEKTFPHINFWVISQLIFIISTKSWYLN